MKECPRCHRNCLDEESVKNVEEWPTTNTALVPLNEKEIKEIQEE